MITYRNLAHGIDEHTVQGDYVGFNTGNGEKLIYSKAELSHASCSAQAKFASISGVECYVVTLYT